MIGAGAAVAAGITAVRRASGRSGATDAEVAGRLPGDELVPAPMWASTRAITIDAAAHDVWPWLAQMGFPTLRAGWYTPHALDRLMRHIRARASGGVRLLSWPACETASSRWTALKERSKPDGDPVPARARLRRRARR